MSEFLSKLTFGFIMAQLFPGAVAVLSITCPLRAKCCQNGDDLATAIEHLDSIWFSSPLRIVVFVFLSAGTGMLIHGIHWATLARLENRKGEGAQPIRKLWYHKFPILFQILCGPVILLGELIWMLIARRLEELVMDENVPHFDKDLFPAHAFLQEFYLYFSQFYAHTAYALLIAIPSFCVLWTTLQWTMSRALFSAGLYVTCGAMFVIGRAQLGSLFKAERCIRERSEVKSGGATTRN